MATKKTPAVKRSRIEVEHEPTKAELRTLAPPLGLVNRGASTATSEVDERAADMMIWWTAEAARCLNDPTYADERAGAVTGLARAWLSRCRRDL